jgi:hypothetical protein
MPDVTFADFVTGLSADTLSGSENFPLLDDATTKKVTASVLAAYVVDQLHEADVITSINGSDEIAVFQADVEKILTADNFFNWVVDKLEAITTGTTITSGDKVLFSDAGVLKQIDIDNVKTFLDSEATALGAQIAALASATLTDTDQYVLAQGSTALKTTFTDIAARVHSQFLAYVAGLPVVATLADADAFYVSDNGVASQVAASVVAQYVQNEVGGAIIASAWDAAAIGGVALSTDVFVLERSDVGRTITGANLASYVISTQNSASDAVSAVSGDGLLMYRSGTQYKLDIDLASSYALAYGFSAKQPVDQVLTADKVLIGRGETTRLATVDQLSTFVLNGVQSTVLNLTTLDAGSLTSGSIFLIGDSTTPEKTTLAQIETQLWTDYQAYVSGLTALTSLEDADVFYVIEGSTPKKITGANIAAYMETELWDKTAASPTVQSGDDLWMRRGSTSYTLDVDELADFVATAVAAGIDLSGLSAGVLSDSDLFLLDDGGTNSKVTLANLRAHFWTEFATYTSALVSASPAADADELYIINSGTAKKITVGDLWDNRYLEDAKDIKLDDFSAPDDNTDLNVSVSAHGLAPKLSGEEREFLRGDGNWSTYASLTATPVAATGSDNTDAASLGTTNTAFITSDSAAKGVKLTAGNAGDRKVVINNSSTASNLYPATGGTLNGLAANAGVVIPASTGVQCFCSAADTWTVFDMPAKATAS